MFLRNGSGAVRKKIDDVFGHTLLSNNDKRSLATLIYYPKEKISYVKKQEKDMENWYKITFYRLDRNLQDHSFQIYQVQSTKSSCLQILPM